MLNAKQQIRPDYTTFRDAVYHMVAAIPRGRVATYGQISVWVGWPRHARLVGHVMRRVPAELHLPCQRVVGSGGVLSPVFLQQRELLLAEGVTFLTNGRVDMRHCEWHPEINV